MHRLPRTFCRTPLSRRSRSSAAERSLTRRIWAVIFTAWLSITCGIIAARTARGWRAVLAAMIPQVIESHAVKITAQILRVSDLSAAELLERRDSGVLQSVRGNLCIANPPQDQRPKTRIVAIDCRQLGNRVRYRRGEIGLRGKDCDGCRVVIETGHERSISRRRE